MSVNTRGNGRPALGRAGGLRSLWRDRRGTVAIYVAISAPILLGIGALSIDLGRLMTVNTELQSAVDAAAGAVANLQTFATGGADVSGDTSDCADPPVAPCIRFLKDLPASDGDPITAANLATSDEEARFIDVHVGARTVTNALIRVVGGPATAATSATAVAGNDQIMCRVPPMWLCNPTEDDSNTDLESPVDIAELWGRQLELFSQVSGGTISPGNFGLLCPLGTNCGASSVRDGLGSREGSCLGVNSAETKTGVTLEMVRSGINARLDYWLPQAKDDNNVPWRQQDRFQPAANVTQGGKKKGGGGNKTACDYNALPATQAMGLPRDECHLDNDCDIAVGNINGNIRIGDGDWDYVEYFRINHGCNPDTNGSCKPADWYALTGGADWPPTRYEVYRYELERTPEEIVTPGQTIYDASGNPVATTAENGHPECFQGTPPPIPGYNYYPGRQLDLSLLNDRRVLVVAVGNCNALTAAGVNVAGKFSFKPSEYVYFFITETMKNPSNTEIYAEILGRVDAASLDSLTRDIVQLYRR